MDRLAKAFKTFNARRTDREVRYHRRPPVLLLEATGLSDERARIEVQIV
jgi:hypothetical protein